MKMKAPIAALVWTALAGFCCAAQASNFVEIHGVHADFYYDTEFWGSATPTVIGNSISFNIADDYTMSAVVKSPVGYGTAYTQDYSQTLASVYLVAHVGYLVDANVTNTAYGTYTLAANGGSVGIEDTLYSTGGSVVNGRYQETQLLKLSKNLAGASSTGTARSGVYVTNNTTVDEGNIGQFRAVAVDTALESDAVQRGPGSSTSAYLSETYGFHISAVPEPETYGMMLAGLGLLCLVARRRKVAALLALMVLGTGVSPIVQASSLVEISGAHVDFFYDTELFGLAAPTVVGDSISFDVTGLYTASVNVKDSLTRTAEVISQGSSTGSSVIAVAHAGYILDAGITYANSGVYSVVGNGGVSSIGGDVVVHGGKAADIFNNNDDSLQFLAQYSSVGAVYSSGSAASGSYATDGQTFPVENYGRYAAITADTFLQAHCQQTGVGSCSAGFTSDTYGFHVVAVPEPEAYGMMLAGVCLMGLFARRRKHTRAI